MSAKHMITVYKHGTAIMKIRVFASIGNLDCRFIVLNQPIDFTAPVFWHIFDVIYAKSMSLIMYVSLYCPLDHWGELSTPIKLSVITASAISFSLK